MTSVHYSSPEGGVDYIQGQEIERRTFQSSFLAPIGKFIGKTVLKLGKSIFKKVPQKWLKQLLKWVKMYSVARQT